MSYILNIESSTAVCSVSLSENGKTKFLQESTEGMKHATHLTVFIEKLFSEAGIKSNQLDAVAVSSGPGSYTGLRIGLSVAKGICFSSDVPLIQLPSLDIIAYGIFLAAESEMQKDDLIYPMIDARRMEVYTACYNDKLIRKNDYYPLIIETPDFFTDLKNKKTFLGGDGAIKFAHYANDFPNLKFVDVLSSAKFMDKLSYEKFSQSEFADVAYSEPFYLKEFKAGIPRSQL